jgi:hypothetical protein
MTCPRERAIIVALLCAAAAAPPARAQVATRPPSDSAPLSPPIFIGTLADDRDRIDFLLSRDRPHTLLRSPSASVVTSPTGEERLRWRLIAPTAELTWNSALPFSLNDGPQWTGRGFSAAVSGGIQLTYGTLGVTLMPTIWFAQNSAFPILPSPIPSRSTFSSPWNVGRLSIDMPTRFGTGPRAAFDVGESAIWVERGPAAVGVSTESQWWGPGIRNALVLSNHAGGFPHVFLRTATPIRSRVGDVEAKWIVGTLSESVFFDRDSDNDLRSISGAVVTLAPARERDLTVGLAHVVYETMDGPGALAIRAFDPFYRFDFNARGGAAKSDHMTSVFGRWRFPAAGAEAYGEWSRMRFPGSLRDLLVAPQYTQGFTVGMQWLPRISDRSRLRFQLEMTNLEQSPELRSGDTLSFYTSSVVPQGYTHRGQVLGASIGPGSSSQWLAIDAIRTGHSVGVFFGRIRWDTEAYYYSPTSVTYYSYDASAFAGVRVTKRFGGRDVGSELTFQRRYNFLFQNPSFGFSRGDDFDYTNFTLKLRVN